MLELAAIFVVDKTYNFFVTNDIQGDKRVACDIVSHGSRKYISQLNLWSRRISSFTSNNVKLMGNKVKFTES